ncbi:MAG: DUF1667 domain-containing protein [Erysipelotrichaceae bacterium]|jgi:CxxC motif-containing protein|nr:DUF1667 domain-containing protein [Erysipelotrichaceae bacterium]
MKQELICIICPRGCHLSVEVKDKTVTSVKGNACPRGEAYAKKELLAPARTLTTTMKVEGGQTPLVSVKSQGEIPKELMICAVQYLDTLTLKAPVLVGQVLVENLLDTGIAVVATAENLEQNLEPVA